VEPLAQESALTVVAEVAIALAGFSSIVIALRGGIDAVTSFAYIRLWRLLETSLAAVLFALIPLALHYAGVPEPTLWRIASGGLCVYIFGAQVYMFIRWWAQWRSPAIPWGFNAPVLACQLGVVVLLGSNTGPGGEFGPYLASLLWYLSLSAMYFARLLLRQRQGDEDLE